MASEVIYALLGGILPALLWLIFWLREDKKNPEPKSLVLRTFVLGMLAVGVIAVFAILFEERALSITRQLSVYSIIWLALIEEILKFGAAYFGGLRSKEDNEPIDPLIYMITAALGFVALENALFVFSPLIRGEIFQSILTSNARFIGASLLHVVSSGIIGVALSFSFYKKASSRIIIGLVGIVGAVVIHTLFNSTITIFKENGSMIASFIVWIGVIFLLWAFERSKAIAR